MNKTTKVFLMAGALTLAACGGNNGGKDGTNNGTVGSNNGTTAGTNNGTAGTNNGTGGTNNGTTAGTNNGTTAGTNNGTTAGTNNGTTNNDLCIDVDCAQLADECMGDVAVTYSGAGTCNPDDGMCEYDDVRTETDCAANGQICEMGACVAADPTPTAGSIQITEIMPNPREVSDSDGEWFEIQNVTNRVIDIQGLVFSNEVINPSETFALPTGTPIELQPGAYYVLGNNADAATNGGVTVDFEYADFNLSNGGDGIAITDANATVIDQLAYSGDTGWPSGNGQSIQFGSDYDLTTDANDDGSFWCLSRTTFGDGDYGTPNAANVDCAAVTATIYDLNDATAANHPDEFRTVNISGVVVTATDGTDYMWLQEQNGGIYSGVYVDVGSVDVSALAVGDVVDVVGSYQELIIGGGVEGLTTLNLSSVTDTGADFTVTPEVLEVSDLMADPEPWENVLIQVQEVGVTKTGLPGNEVRVDAALHIDDLLYGDFNDNAAACEVYASITGPLNVSFDTFKIEPRDANDVGAVTVAAASTGVAAQLNAGFAPSAVCVAEGTTVTWTNLDAAVGHTVTSRLPTETDVSSNIPANPTLDETLPAAGTATYDFTAAGTYHYRCRPHANMTGVVVVTEP